MLSAFTWYFLSMKGRIGRHEFALGLFGLVLIDALVVRLGAKLVGSGPQYYNISPPLDGSILRTLLTASLWPFTAIVVKRLHDFNVSGWWVLCILALTNQAHVLGIPYWILYLVVAATLGALPGRHGDNRFGLDPPSRMGV